MADTRYPTIQRFQEKLEADLLRKAVQAINGVLNGATNNHFKVTLEPGEDQTVVEAPDVASSLAAAVFSPMSDSVVGEEIWIECGSGEFTVHHEELSGTDRMIGVTIHGG